MHHLDIKETHWEKAWNLQKNATGFSEQILEVALQKIVALQPPVFHFTIHLLKTNKLYGTLLEKYGGTN